jgi:hypothetical protein
MQARMSAWQALRKAVLKPEMWGQVGMLNRRPVLG